MKHLLIASLFAMLAFVSTNASATSPLAADLTGIVVDANKQPVANATITVYHLDTGRVQVKQTNAKGRYNFLGLRHDGTYVVVATHGDSLIAHQGKFLLGHAHKRNFVVGLNGSKPDFMKSWQWKQNDAIESIEPLMAAQSATYRRGLDIL